jgi:hypothetical protein
MSTSRTLRAVARLAALAHAAKERHDHDAATMAALELVRLLSFLDMLPRSYGDLATADAEALRATMQREVFYRVSRQSKRTRAAETPWEDIAHGLSGPDADRLVEWLAQEHPSFRYAITASFRSRHAEQVIKW